MKTKKQKRYAITAEICIDADDETDAEMAVVDMQPTCDPPHRERNLDITVMDIKKNVKNKG